jgi:ribosomal protein S18 acetylase RimI-like enzyme
LETVSIGNLKRASLAEAADANLVAHAGWTHTQIAGMRLLDQGELVLIDSGLPSDTFNLNCRARLDPAAAPARVREAVAYFRQVRRPFSWWVGPADQPHSLGQMLRALGLEGSEQERLMAANLDDLQPSELSPTGLRILRVQSTAQLRSYAQILAHNWTPPDAHVLRFYALAEAALLGSETPLWLYLAFVGEEPVATAELTVGGGVVGVYNAATIESYRRRGFATALIRHCLQAAREKGYRTAVLQAAPRAESVYQRLGFQAFGEITEYKPAVHHPVSG